MIRSLDTDTIALPAGEARRAYTPGPLCPTKECPMLRVFHMIQMARFDLRRLVKDEEGASAIEYGLIAGGIAIGIIATVVLIGGQLSGIFTRIQTDLATVPGAS